MDGRAPDSVLVFERTAAHDHPMGRGPMAASERRRLEDTAALVPADADTVLDVGCGPGTLLHFLDRPRSFGTDLGRVGLRHCDRPVVRSSITRLPFPTGGVDLVICAEVLEHLAPADLHAAAAELWRVARRAVLVTVPWRERLLESSARCPACGLVFHLHGHRTVWDEERLVALFPPDAPRVLRRSWPVRPWSDALLRLRTRGLSAWKHSDNALCPGCGNRGFPNREGGLAWRLVGALNHLRHPRRTSWNWLLARFDKP